MVARSYFRIVGDFELWRRAPKALEIVVAARLFAENVQNEATEIDERPFSGAAPLAVLWGAMKLFFELVLDFATDRLHLRRAESRADHEVVRKGADAAEIENSNACCFFILRGLDGEAHALWQGFEFQRYRPCLRMYSSTRAETSP
jgi:hypothetical protein